MGRTRPAEPQRRRRPPLAAPRDTSTKPWYLPRLRGIWARVLAMPRRADVSLLFDFFVVSQRLRRVLTAALAESGMRPDEYAVYSLLQEKGPLTATEMAELMAMPLTTVLEYLKAMTAAGHVVRTAHPFDGRATLVRLNRRGLAAQERAHAHWEVARRQ